MTTKDSFDHSFDGLSVWLELLPTSNDQNDNTTKNVEACAPTETNNSLLEYLTKDMTYLQHACGGSECGVVPFVPHITMLYNLPLQETDPQYYQQLLNTCVQQLSSRMNRKNDNSNNNNSNNNNNNNNDQSSPPSSQDAPLRQSTTEIPGKTHVTNNHPYIVIPKDWFFLHYPKSASNGRGFGCSIAGVLLEQRHYSGNDCNDWLLHLFETCLSVFGPDERHGDILKARSNYTRANLANYFTPHLSLVYAPENVSSFLQSHVDQQRTKRPFHATSTQSAPKCATHSNTLPIQYLSVWSTKGKIQDWFRIAKVALPL